MDRSCVAHIYDFIKNGLGYIYILQTILYLKIFMKNI